jgi:hypothetical protein
MTPVLKAGQIELRSDHHRRGVVEEVVFCEAEAIKLGRRDDMRPAGHERLELVLQYLPLRGRAQSAIERTRARFVELLDGVAHHQTVFVGDPPVAAGCTHRIGQRCGGIALDDGLGRQVGGTHFDAAHLIAIFKCRVEPCLVLYHRSAHRSGVLLAAERRRAERGIDLRRRGLQRFVARQRLRRSRARC